MIGNGPSEGGRERAREGGREGERVPTCSNSRMFLGTCFNPSGPSISNAWSTCIPATNTRADRQVATRLGGRKGRREGGREGGKEGRRKKVGAFRSVF